MRKLVDLIDQLMDSRVRRYTMIPENAVDTVNSTIVKFKPERLSSDVELLFVRRELYGELYCHDIVSAIRGFLMDDDLLNFNRLSSVYRENHYGNDIAKYDIYNRIQANQLSFKRQFYIYNRLNQLHQGVIGICVESDLKRYFFNAYLKMPFYEKDLESDVLDMVKKIISAAESRQSIIAIASTSTATLSQLELLPEETDAQNKIEWMLKWFPYRLLQNNVSQELFALCLWTMCTGVPLALINIYILYCDFLNEKQTLSRTQGWLIKI